MSVVDVHFSCQSSLMEVLPALNSMKFNNFKENLTITAASHYVPPIQHFYRRKKMYFLHNEQYIDAEYIRDYYL